MRATRPKTVEYSRFCDDDESLQELNVARSSVAVSSAEVLKNISWKTGKFGSIMVKTQNSVVTFSGQT